MYTFLSSLIPAFRDAIRILLIGGFGQQLSFFIIDRCCQRKRSTIPLRIFTFARSAFLFTWDSWLALQGNLLPEDRLLFVFFNFLAPILVFLGFFWTYEGTFPVKVLISTLISEFIVSVVTLLAVIPVNLLEGRADYTTMQGSLHPFDLLLLLLIPALFFLILFLIRRILVWFQMWTPVHKKLWLCFHVGFWIALQMNVLFEGLGDMNTLSFLTFFQYQIAAILVLLGSILYFIYRYVRTPSKGVSPFQVFLKEHTELAVSLSESSLGQEHAPGSYWSDSAQELESDSDKTPAAQGLASNSSSLTLAQGLASNSSSLTPAQGLVSNSSSLTPAQGLASNSSSLTPAQESASNYSNLTPAQGLASNYSNLTPAQEPTSNYSNLTPAAAADSARETVESKNSWKIIPRKNSPEYLNYLTEVQKSFVEASKEHWCQDWKVNSVLSVIKKKAELCGIGFSCDFMGFSCGRIDSEDVASILYLIFYPILHQSEELEYNTKVGSEITLRCAATHFFLVFHISTPLFLTDTHDKNLHSLAGTRGKDQHSLVGMRGKDLHSLVGIRGKDLHSLVGMRGKDLHSLIHKYQGIMTSKPDEENIKLTIVLNRA